jgi:hypothetical protein
MDSVPAKEELFVFVTVRFVIDVVPIHALPVTVKRDVLAFVKF